MLFIIHYLFNYNEDKFKVNEDFSPLSTANRQLFSIHGFANGDCPVFQIT